MFNLFCLVHNSHYFYYDYTFTNVDHIFFNWITIPCDTEQFKVTYSKKELAEFNFFWVLTIYNIDSRLYIQQLINPLSRNAPQCALLRLLARILKEGVQFWYNDTSTVGGSGVEKTFLWKTIEVRVWDS
jgi:hypothetical protein